MALARFAMLLAALAARATASTGGKPRQDLPPLFLVPSLCGSRIRAWSNVPCSPIDVPAGTDAWVNVALIGAQSSCWVECMRLWGPNMSDAPSCVARADEGVDAIYNLADGILGMFAHSMSGVIDALIKEGYDSTTLTAMPYDFRLTPEVMETRDGYFSRFKALIETNVKRRGQRAVIYGHSMGCKVSAYFFAWLGSQFSTEKERLAWIDQHVGMYVSNGGPLLGSPDIVPTLMVGQTMGMPISLKQIREVLASAGGLAYLMPSPRAAGARATPLPEHAEPYGKPWFQIDWGGKAGVEAFGPELCCGPTSAVAGFEKAAQAGGDSLLADIAVMVRKAATAEPFVGSLWDPKITELRPPVDIVIAAYGVGYKTPLANTFALEKSGVPIDPPIETAKLEAAGVTEYDGLPLRRSGATWTATETLYEQGVSHREVVDAHGKVVAGGKDGGAPFYAKAGDMTVTYASLSVAHDWLGAEVHVANVPLRTFFTAAEVVNGSYDAPKRAAVLPEGYQTCDAEPRMTIFESRSPTSATGAQHTEVWEMDNVVHRDSSNNDIFIEHFLRELREYSATGVAAGQLELKTNARSFLHVKDFKPEGDGACYWDYKKAACGTPKSCEYRFQRGDLHLSQSCRLKSTRGPPPEAPRDDADCHWDYARARCAFPTVCHYSYKFGDTELGQSCRVRPDVDYSKEHFHSGRGRLPWGLIVGVTFAVVLTAAAYIYVESIDDGSEAFHAKRV